MLELHLQEHCCASAKACCNGEKVARGRLTSICFCRWSPHVDLTRPAWIALHLQATIVHIHRMPFDLHSWPSRLIH